MSINPVESMFPRGVSSDGLAMTRGNDIVHQSLMDQFRSALEEEARLDPRLAPANHEQLARYADAHRRAERIRQQIRAAAPSSPRFGCDAIAWASVTGRRSH